MNVHSGSCHCGAVRFRVTAAIDELTTCDCSLCRRRNALMAKAHESALTILAGDDLLTAYGTPARRNTSSARAAASTHSSQARRARSFRDPCILSSGFRHFGVSGAGHGGHRHDGRRCKPATGMAGTAGDCRRDTEIAGGQFEQATRKKYPDRKNKNAAFPKESGVLFDRDT
jgi:hypothetical protein